MENKIEQTLELTNGWLIQKLTENITEYRLGKISKKRYKKTKEYLNGYRNCLMDIKFKITEN